MSDMANYNCNNSTLTHMHLLNVLSMEIVLLAETNRMELRWNAKENKKQHLYNETQKNKWDIIHFILALCQI